MKYSTPQKAGLAVVFVLGFTAIPAQIILMREFLLVFGGNELIIGLFLAYWMLLTACGSFAARFIHVNDAQIPAYTVFLAWLPLILLYLIDLLRNRILLPGIEPGLFQILLSFFLILPFCFLSGLLFANMAAHLIRLNTNQAAGKTYALESIGSMAGGLLFSLVLIYLNDNFRSAALVALMGSILVMYFAREKIGRPRMIWMSSAVLLLMTFTYAAGSHFPRHFLFRNQELLETLDTPYGNLSVTGTSGQMNVFENNTLLFSTDNQLASEEAVHFAMLQHPFPRRVLLISGGIAGLTGEILKYGTVEELDYIEIDPVILEIGKKYTRFLDNKKIHLIGRDPRIYLNRTDRKYDVVIVYLPSPSTFQINRYYTIEFMTAVKNCMNRQGIFTFSLPLTGNYLNGGTVKMYSSLLHTCNTMFPHVYLFPGLNTYFVASDREVKDNIGQLIENKNINTDYVNSYFIDDAELKRHSQEITNQLQPGECINADFKPVAISGFYQYWLNRFQVEFVSFRLYVIFLAAVIIIGLAASPPAYSGMFAAGFTASALQVILILSFQIVYGYIYRSIGLFTAVFMIGLATGGMLQRKVRADDTLILVCIQLCLVILSGLIPELIKVSAGLIRMPLLVHLIYLAAIWLISLVAGVSFSVSVDESGKHHAGNISAVYGADLAGASLGAFLTILLLIPLAGIKSAPYMACSLNIMVAAIMIIRRKFTNRG